MKTINLKIETPATCRWLKTIQVSFTIIATVALCMTSACNKEETGKTSGTIKYNNKIYTVSIGEIGKNDLGNIWIELKSELPIQLSIKNGNVVPEIAMRIVVDNKTYEFDYLKLGEEIHEFSFIISKNPNKIIVYSNDGSNSTLTFDGKSKKVIK